MQWAINSAPSTSTVERLILIKLAEHANPDGTDSFPAIRTIAKTAHCDRRTVQRHVAALEQRGLIAKGNQAAAQHIRPDRRPTVWDLLIPRSWFSDDQWRGMQLDRDRRGLPPLSEASRPDLPAPDGAATTDTATSYPQVPTGNGAAHNRPARGVAVPPRRSDGAAHNRPAASSRGGTGASTGRHSAARTSPINQSTTKRSLTRSLNTHSALRAESARDTHTPPHTRDEPTPPRGDHPQAPKPPAVHEPPQLTLIPGIPEPTTAEAPKPHQAKRKTARATYTPEFEAFWELYGRRGTKADAARQFAKALERVDPETLMAAARAYVKATPEIRYRKHAERWLAKDGWESAIPENTLPAASNGGYVPYRNENISNEERMRGFY